MGVITSIRRNVKNAGRCSVFVDDAFFAACPIDVALSLGLRKGLEMSDEIERQLRREDRRIVLRQKAYRFATYKPRTERDIARFLMKAEATDEESADVMQWLREFRLIDDVAYAGRFIEASKQRKPLSPAMMRRALLGKGLPESIVEGAIATEAHPDDAHQAARIVARKKLRMITSEDARVTEDKLVRFLQYRGYSWTVIKDVISEWKNGSLLLAIILLTACVTALSQPDTSCNKTRLSEAINKFQVTTMPVMGPEGELYLDRKHHPDNHGGADDLWVSYNTQGQWTTAERADILIYDPMMKAYNRADVVFGMSKDGLHALVAGRFMKNSLQPALAFLHRSSIKAPFTGIQVVEPELGNNFYATFAEDMGAVVVALKRADGIGDLDLYVIKLDSGDKLSGNRRLIPLGSAINTTAFEGAPWLACDGRTLYFASAGRDDRRGKADMYMARRLDDTWQAWSEPVNLGPCINSTHDETAFSLPCGSGRAFVTSWDPQSDRTGVYTVDLPANVLPRPVNTVTIRAHNALSGEPVVPLYVDILSEQGSMFEEDRRVVQADTVGGFATTVLEQDTTLIMRARSVSRGVGSWVGIPHRVSSTTADISVDLPVVPANDTPLLRIYFDKDQDSLSAESVAAIDSLITKIGRSTLLRLLVKGYTDASGPVHINNALAASRARAVAQRCQPLLVDPLSEIRTEGVGLEIINGKPVSADAPLSRRADIYAIGR